MAILVECSTPSWATIALNMFIMYRTGVKQLSIFGRKYIPLENLHTWCSIMLWLERPQQLCLLKRCVFTYLGPLEVHWRCRWVFFHCVKRSHEILMLSRTWTFKWKFNVIKKLKECLGRFIETSLRNRSLGKKLFIILTMPFSCLTI